MWDSRNLASNLFKAVSKIYIIRKEAELLTLGTYWSVIVFRILSVNSPIRIPFLVNLRNNAFDFYIGTKKQIPILHYFSTPTPHKKVFLLSALLAVLSSIPIWKCGINTGKAEGVGR